MSFRQLIGGASVVVVLGCGGATPSPASAASFNESEYVLVVDQRYRAGCGSLQRPSDAIPDSCYEPATPSVRYAVRLSENGSRVEVVGADGAPVRGSVEQGHGTDRVFGLEMFAGGRLRISGTAAELTVFGSGVPFVKSERGQLTAR